MSIKSLIIRGFVLLVLAACVVIGAWSLIVPKAGAMPGQCQQGFAGGNGGGFCDGFPDVDGTFMHCETVYVLGFGGTNCFRVRPVPVSVDPRGWVPA